MIKGTEAGFEKSAVIFDNLDLLYDKLAYLFCGYVGSLARQKVG
jgi:hypothetical protein